MMTEPILPIDEQVISVQPTLFEELAAEANNAPALALTPSVVAAQIEDELTLSSRALGLSASSNLLPSANAAPSPAEVASTAVSPTASEFERLLQEGFSVPHVGEQLAMTVSNFEINTGHPVLDVAG